MQTLKKLTLFLFLTALAFWWVPFSLAPHHSAGEDEDFMITHVADSYSCHFGGVTLFLPILIYRPSQGISCFSSSHLYHGAAASPTYEGVQLVNHHLVDVDGEVLYDFSITKNVFFIFLSLLLLLLLLWALASRYTQRRGQVGGFWVFPLFLVRFVRDEIAKPYIGLQHYRRFTPYLLTVFFYILFNNLFGLLPGAGNVTGNISVVFVLAMGTFFLTNLNGNRHYWGHIFNPPGVPKFVFPILVPIEFLGIFIKAFTLMLRLFLNMLAGHLLLTAILGIIFILNTLFVAIIAVPFAAAILLLKIFVSFLQAYVFTLLTAISLGSAVAEHQEADDSH